MRAVYGFVLGLAILTTAYPAQGDSSPAHLGLSIGLGNHSTVTTHLVGRFELPLGSFKFSPLIRYSFISRSGSIPFGTPTDWSVQDPNLHTLNAGFEFDWEFAPMFELGFNLDLFGLGFGGNKTMRDSGAGSATGAPPSSNLFLFAKNDVGSLCSQLFFATRVWSPMRILAGFSHQVYQYEPSTPMAGIPKFQTFFDVFFVGVEWRL